jgi:hypothetical protein
MTGVEQVQLLVLVVMADTLPACLPAAASVSCSMLPRMLQALCCLSLLTLRMQPSCTPTPSRPSPLLRHTRASEC